MRFLGCPVIYKVGADATAQHTTTSGANPHDIYDALLCYISYGDPDSKWPGMWRVRCGGSPSEWWSRARMRQSPSPCQISRDWNPREAAN